MNLSIETIERRFPYVFKNEFNERKILHHVIDENWGREVALNFVSSSPFTGTQWGVQRANEIRNFSRTLVITEDKYGAHQLFQFWHDFSRNMMCYSEIKTDVSLFDTRFRKNVA